MTAIFAAGLLLSSSLLFLVQPMVAKMALPRLGGSPAVWNTCIVFFQSLLLLGYGYAHLLSSRFTLGRQVIVHATLLSVAALALPVSIPEAWLPPVDHSPIPWLLTTLTVRVGGPVLLLAASAPLLQTWFARTDHPTASDPYFLYTASNLGSILALLLYPFLIEPAWAVGIQAAHWASGYRALVGVIVATGVAAWYRRRPELPHSAEVPVEDARDRTVTWGRRTIWVLLAFVPSSLMLGVTTYLSTDVAAVPLMWIVPLVLYLLTFVIAFAARPIFPRLATRAVPLLMLPVLLTVVTGSTWPLLIAAPIHILLFFLCALLLHTELARSRPAASHLTEFYLWISLGGALGGVVNTIIAPLVFTSVLEYPLALALAALLQGATSFGKQGWFVRQDWTRPAVLGVAAAAVAAMVPPDVDLVIKAAAVGPFVVWCFSFSRRPVRYGLALALFIIAFTAFQRSSGQVLFETRTFFGVLRVHEDAATKRHLLYHGNTLHGEQSVDRDHRREPLSYYHHGGPIGQLITHLGPSLDGARIGVVGLGTGALAAYARPGQQWTFFEIDPSMEKIARDPHLFTHLHDCGAACRVVLGDARLSLQHNESTTYDLLVLDAFSSDAIPVHLLTREALRLYESRLTENGVLAFHISNRYMDLRPLLAGLAREAGFTALTQVHRVTAPETGARSSVWFAMSPSSEALQGLQGDSRWRVSRFAPSTALWTDTYSNVLGAFR